AEARASFDPILRDLMEALAQAADPRPALSRWEALLSRLPTAVDLFRLFEQRPGLPQQALRILTPARPLADARAPPPHRRDRQPELRRTRPPDRPAPPLDRRARVRASPAGRGAGRTDAPGRRAGLRRVSRPYPPGGGGGAVRTRRAAH